MRQTIAPARRPLLVLVAVASLALATAAGCADDGGDPGTVSGDGSSGAEAGSDGVGGGGADATDGVADADDRPDLPTITEIPENLDIAYLFDIPPDAGPEDAASLPDAAGAGDSSAADTSLEDAGPEDAWNPGFDTFLTECESIGIAESWEGAFQGEIQFDINTGGAVPPELEQGLLPVGGTLTFTISCIESKLVVSGTLSGVASVQDQGDFPFSLTLQGYYSPSANQLSAQLVDGMVSIYGLLEVYFVGQFQGQLQEDGTFDGTWSAQATGTNNEMITGDADGTGTWTASEAVTP